MEPSDFARAAAWLIRSNDYEEIARQWIGWNEKTSDEQSALIMRVKQDDKDRPLYALDDSGVATIEIRGPLSKRETFFSFLFGGANYERIGKAFQAAVDDASVKSILFRVDSPGGVLTGLDSLADQVYQARGSKPIVAYADGLAASAAYWIASAADTVIAEKTAQVGSIGVLLVHTDFSEYDRKQGIKTTYLTAGKYKAIGNPDSPLDEFSRSVLQERLDFYYGIFLEAVARNRGVDETAVVSDMADGRVFIGEQALKAGLVDSIGNYEAARERAASMANDGNTRKQGAIKMSEIKTIEALTEKYPSLVAQIVEQAEQNGESKAMETVEQARDGERDRVLDLISAQFGDEAGEKMKTIVESGVTVEQFQAIKGLAGDGGNVQGEKESDEERAAREAALKAIEDSGADNPGADAGATGQNGKDYLTLVAEYKEQHKCGAIEAQTAISKAYPDKKREFLEGQGKLSVAK